MGSNSDPLIPSASVQNGPKGGALPGNILRRHEDVAFWDTPKYSWGYGSGWWPDDCLTVEHARPRVVRYIRNRFARFTKQQGKKRFFENTQAKILALPFVNAVLPDSKIIHIIRDGRDNAGSQRYRYRVPDVSTAAAVRRRVPGIPITDWPAYLPEFLSIVLNRLCREEYVYTIGPKIRNWKRLRRELDMLEYIAINWRECVTAARRFGKTLPPGRYHEVRFEELLTNPNKILCELLEFLELPPSDKTMAFASTTIDPTRKGRRVRELSQEELDRIMPHIKSSLAELNLI